jgi:aspartate ammonia-lyase
MAGDARSAAKEAMMLPSSTGSDAEYRMDLDPLGEVRVPAASLHGPQTERACCNFPLSGVPVAAIEPLVRALAQVKKAAAITNREIGDLSPTKAKAIIAACDEILAGGLRDHFCVDVCQGGAGTSTNMNANEVIANRALQLLGFAPGRYDVLHPNDDVNRNQSTNDAYATAVRLAVHAMNAPLVSALERLAAAFEAKAYQFRSIAKLGRTQLQDAVPITLGGELGAYATTLREDAARAGELVRLFLEVNIGGTAVGTGIAAHPLYRERIGAKLAETVGLPITIAPNLIEATWDMGAFVLYSGLLKRIAAKLSKISNDLRLLSSGPSGGFGEIALPKRQPGSSIMPGKVNPVIPEAMSAIAYRVFGLDLTITFAAEAGQLQLNPFEPVICWSIHEAVTLLTRGMDMLAEHCVSGIEAVESRCRDNLLRSTALATELVPRIGYARAAAVAMHAQQHGDLATSVALLEPEMGPVLQALLAP